MSRVKVKICGLTRPEDATHAARAGADYLGLVFFPPSPRAIDPRDAGAIVAGIPSHVCKVALLVDPDDALIDTVAQLPVDMLQLHGHESPDRVEAIKSRTGLPVMKAIGVREAGDLAGIQTYADVADQLLIDAKPPKGATRPGGNAIAFDWRLLTGLGWPLPWMLAGGLSAETVAEAVRITGAHQLDISSGVERAPGIKDPDKVSMFIEAAHAVPYSARA